MAQFGDLTLSEDVLRGLQEMGFEEPTPVQLQAIPPLLAGRDVVAQALTGTGKTAAFGIPLVECIDVTRHVPQAIILTPTRELAVQVAEHITRLGRHRHLRLLPIYGGQPIARQLTALRRGVHAIVATPGRLMDHMRRGTVELGQVKMLVLDEADQMLQMGFQEDVEYILEHISSERVTALFSATMPQPILNIVHQYMRDAEMIRLSKPKALTAPRIDQSYYIVPFPQKFEALARVLDARQPDRTLVFCATKRMVDEVVDRLQARGFDAEGLHGDVSQPMREKVLRNFRDATTDVLVATDVAARGLDITDVTIVVNFDIPPDPEYYVHRIGRTGRVGRKGEAITFVNPREMRELKAIERVTGATITRGRVPSALEAEEREEQLLAERLLNALGKNDWGRYRSVIESLVDDYDVIDIAAAAVSLATRGNTSKARSRADAAPPSEEQGRPTQRAAQGRHASPRQTPAGRNASAARKGGAPPRHRDAAPKSGRRRRAP